MYIIVKKYNYKLFDSVITIVIVFSKLSVFHSFIACLLWICEDILYFVFSSKVTNATVRAWCKMNNHFCFTINQLIWILLSPIFPGMFNTICLVHSVGKHIFKIMLFFFYFKKYFGRCDKIFYGLVFAILWLLVLSTQIWI